MQVDEEPSEIGSPARVSEQSRRSGCKLTGGTLSYLRFFAYSFKIQHIEGQSPWTEKNKTALILAELARLYPDARPALRFANPFELLVAVMLSAQCTDVKVNMVTPALFAAYPDAAALAKAEPAGDRADHQDLRPVSQQGQNLVLMARGADCPLRRRGARRPRRAGIPARCGAQDGERRDELCVRRGRHRRGYARLPRRQPAGAGRCARRAQNRASAHAKHPAEPMEPRAPLADLSRPPRVRRPKACLKAAPCAHGATMPTAIKRQKNKRTRNRRAPSNRRTFASRLERGFWDVGQGLPQAASLLCSTPFCFPADAGYYQPDGRRPDCDRLHWLALPLAFIAMVWWIYACVRDTVRLLRDGVAPEDAPTWASMQSGGCRMNWRKSPRWMGAAKRASSCSASGRAFRRIRAGFDRSGFCRPRHACCSSRGWRLCISASPQSVNRNCPRSKATRLPAGCDRRFPLCGLC